MRYDHTDAFKIPSQTTAFFEYLNSINKDFGNIFFPMKTTSIARIQMIHGKWEVDPWPICTSVVYVKAIDITMAKPNASSPITIMANMKFLNA